MVQALQQPISFDEFVEWLPESSEYRYELRRGVVVEMPKPRGMHSDVAGYTALKAGMEIERSHLPYFVPKECIVRSQDGSSGYEPDVVVLDRRMLGEEPRWERESIITLGQSIKLIVEVVSTNWQDDYLYKLAEYLALGIQEYWVIDYAGLGGRLYIGNPKRPTFSVYELVEGEHDVRLFRGSDRILSPVFPDLALTAEQFFAAGQSGF